MTPRTTNFEEHLRYEYDLSPDSRVLDAGAYKGTFSRTLAERYDCHIDAFEPVFFEECRKNLKGFSKVTVHEEALHWIECLLPFHIKGDMTGQFAEGPYKEVLCLNIASWVKNLDLLKLNVEGMEFDLLEHLLDEGLMSEVRNLQVQFHDVAPNARERHTSIRERLLLTHHLTFDFPWCWENYERNSL